MPLMSAAQRECLERRAFRSAHALQMARLRVESWIARLLFPGSPRVAATACWTFPIYSQTFVHQEVAALARGGFAVRFFYTQQGPRTELAHACRDLWPLRRRVLLSRETGAADLTRFRRRMPEKVDALIDRLAAASGLSREEIAGHEHFLHAFSFARAVEAWGADYLHSYFFYERTLFAFVSAHLLDLPRGVSCYADHLLRDYPLKVVPLHLRTCDLVIATSRRIRAELEQLRGAPIDAALVKPNAIDTSSFTVRTRHEPVGGGPLQLLCVSRLDPKKGIEYLLDALVLLKRRGFAPVARIVGAADAHSAESQAYADMLRAKAREIGVADAVDFAGRRTSQEVREYLAQADVFVAPFVELPNGDKDGIPTAVLEAMAAGSVIVASDAGSMDEIIDSERDGLIVPQRDGAALASAIERVARDGGLATRLAASAAARARREFDIATSELAFHDRVRGAIGLHRGAPVKAGVQP